MILLRCLIETEQLTKFSDVVLHRLEAFVDTLQSPKLFHDQVQELSRSDNELMEDHHRLRQDLCLVLGVRRNLVRLGTFLDLTVMIHVLIDHERDISENCVLMNLDSRSPVPMEKN